MLTGHTKLGLTANSELLKLRAKVHASDFLDSNHGPSKH